MENVERESIGQIRAIDTRTEPGEGLRLARGCLLDELAGAAFIAITLMWIVTSLGGLAWCDIPIEVTTHLHALIRALAGSHALAMASHVTGAASFAKTVYGFFNHRGPV